MPNPAPSPPARAEKPRSEHAYDALKMMILSGEVRPGERLTERELSGRLGVSRTPLREALRRLERDGLAVNEPGRGCFALQFDPDVVRELYDFRELLEVHAVRRAAEEGSAEELRELQQLLADLQRYGRMPKPGVDALREESEIGLRLHEVIARAGANRFVCESLLQIYDRLRLLTWIDTVWFDMRSKTRKEHRELVEAVVARDPGRAARVTRRHVRRAKLDSLWVISAQQKERSHASRTRPVRSFR